MNTYTKIFKLTRDNFSEVIGECAEIIRKVALLPSLRKLYMDSAANALDPIAVNRIFHAKGRCPDNPLIVHVASIEQLEQLVSEVPPKALSLIEAFWPGPLDTYPQKDWNCTRYHHRRTGHGCRKDAC